MDSWNAAMISSRVRIGFIVVAIIIVYFIRFVCKDSVKFRLSEKKTNKFAFYSVRNLSISSETQKIKIYFVSEAME